MPINSSKNCRSFYGFSREYGYMPVYLQKEKLFLATDKFRARIRQDLLSPPVSAQRFPASEIHSLLHLGCCRRGTLHLHGANLVFHHRRFDCKIRLVQQHDLVAERSGNLFERLLLCLPIGS